jgi:DNA invertase Pin-like site-specific DNA recombinase
VNVYTDEGLSATSTKKREGFKQMMADALAGKIDLIITKSVSRFARNTVDSLTSIRQLKEKGVECYFEKENIWTFDGTGELLLTIMSSLAQEESRSLSQNVAWGIRKQMADGKIHLPWSRFLGYRKGKDGKPESVPKEAETVRLIYSLFLEGETYAGIARILTEKGIPTPRGKRVWIYDTVKSILANETYKGDKLLQKAYTVDYLTKKRKVNTGELPQHYLTESHEAIIPPAQWEAATTCSIDI